MSKKDLETTADYIEEADSLIKAQKATISELVQLVHMLKDIIKTYLQEKKDVRKLSK